LYIESNNGFDGGFDSGNEVLITASQFYQNSAQNGAGMFCEGENAVMIDDTLFDQNFANFSGGGVAMREKNTLTIVGSELRNNTATSGGGLSMQERNTVTLQNSRLSQNRASLYGGGICGLYLTQLHFVGENSIYGNIAGEIGGGLLLAESPLWSVNGSLYFQHNGAKRGSGVFLKAAEVTAETLHDVVFDHNNASVGGTFYWMYEEGMSEEPKGMGEVRYRNNTAPYGAEAATQAVSIQGPDTYNNTLYGAYFDPPLVYSLQDYYSSFMHINGPTVLSVEISNPTAKECEVSIKWV
jgi:predicted outer membrane repeat protein